MSNITATIIEASSGSSITCQDVVSLSFNKEWYTPYSTLSITLLSDTALSDSNEITLIINSKIIHDGPIYSLEAERQADGRFQISIYSKSYTAALGVNQPIPKINSDVNLEDILTSNITLPNISCEADTDTVNYVYILDKDTLWDAIVAYSIKAYDSYPFIRGANTVRVTPPDSGYSIFSYSSEVLTTSYGTNLSNLISKINMKDFDESYETYELENTYATERDIIREKKINYDSQWLSEPEAALEKRVKYSNRATSYKAVKVLGYSGEDLFDKFTVQVDGSSFIRLKRIHRIHISANQNGIVTRLYTYFDSYSGDISIS
ncbi:MAG: hypothetical protein LUC25_07660 [Ruminococcus sp.]|nr:hypothetical protein [Ruminococcus sp.]